MKQQMKWFLIVALLMASLLAQTAHARIAAESIPPELAPWRDWVLHGQENELCPGQYNDPSLTRCQWPTRLHLDVADDGARFEQRWYVFAPGWIILPGGEGLWPDGVLLNGNAAVVVAHDGLPAMFVPTGEHQIQGRFFWEQKPDAILLPPSLGLFSLTLDGMETPAPDIIDQNRLLLNHRPAADKAENQVRITIFRLLKDSIPMQVETLMRMDVVGDPREIQVAGGLLDGSTAMALDSPLPAHLNNENLLIVQARPGRWEIRIQARLNGPRTRIEAGLLPYGPEIWSFAPYHHLRMVEVTGVGMIEPGQTDMPEAWRRFQAYAVSQNDIMTFKELRRGNPDPPPDQLKLRRTWWLNFNGTGFTIHDTVTGTINRQWALALNPPGVLGRVAVNGQNQVITAQGEAKKAGVELRSGKLALTADAQMEGPGKPLPIVGWDHDFDQVAGTLHLPPGWRLLAASGIDNTSDSWLQNWSLLDFFLVLIIALAAFKLRNWKWGAAALVLMVLIFQEPGAPRLVWLHLLAVTALLSFIPKGWLRRGVIAWGMCALLVLVIQAVPFIITQIRWGIYPQLASHESWTTQDYNRLRGAGVENEALNADVDAEMEYDRPAPAPSRQAMDMKKATERPYGSASSSLISSVSKPYFGPEPDTLIPTGPGLPKWRWQTISLAWNGPVTKDQTMRLFLVSPTINLLLAFLRVGLLIGVAGGWFLNRSNRQKIRAVLAENIGPSLSSAIVIFTLLMMTNAPMAQAQETPTGFPPQPLLEELKQRLLAPPDCMDACGDISRMEINLSDDQMVLMLKVHTATQTAVPLPANKTEWSPAQVLMDNAPISGLASEADGQLWAMVPPGVHTILMSGSVSRSETVQLSLLLKPHMISVNAPDWDVRGLLPDNAAASTLQLVRRRQKHTPAAQRDIVSVTPFFQVERRLELGLTWQVTTLIHRITPVGSPAMINIPLLTDEAVTTPGISIDGNMALVHFATDQREAVYTATLPVTTQIVLTAPKAVPWVETWRLDAATIWHYDTHGITAIQLQTADGLRQSQWQPWPGESVTIDISRPSAIAGKTKTIDQADLTISPGRRFGIGELTLHLRTSQGGQHTVALPENANLQAVTVDQNALPVRQEGRLVTLPLKPGAQTIYLRWHQASVFSWHYQTPEVDVGTDAVNARLTLKMPDNRWTLATFGPRWGPAVLFWSYLIALVLMAIVLSRIPVTRLKTRHWLLLILGLTQIPIGMALIIAGWLVVLGLRDKGPMPGNRLAFNGIQIGLILWTLAAFVCLFESVRAGLIGQPQMHIVGNGSNSMTMNWTMDHINGLLPRARVFNLSVWVYRGLMLLWALWLALSLIQWLQWGWRCFSRDQVWMTLNFRRKSSKADPKSDAKAKTEAEKGAPPLSWS